MLIKKWTNRAIFFQLRCVAFVLALAQSKITHLPHPTGTYLRGPVNQTVHQGNNVRFQCRLQNRVQLGATDASWDKMASNKHLYVQWIIDGFGVTNETLKSVHAERYHMPGPINEGIYDLVITDVQLEDEASFICQAHVKLYREDASPIMETIASKPVYLSIVIPPNGVFLRKLVVPPHFYQNSNREMTNSITIAWNNSTGNTTLSTHMKGAWNRGGPSASNRTVADDPTMIEKYRSFVEATTSNYHSRTNLSSSRHSGLPVNSKHELSQRISPVLWVKEKEQLNLECRTTPSKPVSRIVWLLAGSLLRPTHKSHRLDQQYTSLSSSTMLWQKFPFKDNGFSNTSPLGHEERFDIEEKQMVVQVGAHGLGHLVGSENYTDVMKISVSVLRLVVQKHHQRQVLQCRVENTADFMVRELPTVSAVIEPLFVDDIRIEPVSTLHTAELREGFDAEYQCTAKTNPPSAVYRWMLIRERSKTETSLTSDSDPYDVTQPTTTNAVSYDKTNFRLRLQRDMHHSRIVCWVGVKMPDISQYPFSAESAFIHPDQPKEQMTWGKSDHELNILYAAIIDQTSSNLQAVKLDQLVKLDCSADANPVASISLYRLGEAGNRMLHRLSELHSGPNQSFTISQRQDSVQSTSVLRSELSLNELEYAIKTEGSQVLTSATQNISYSLHIRRVEDLGFYICMARNSDFPPAFRYVFVGEAGPPNIIQCRQIPKQNGLSMELVCLVHSIPRPKTDQIIWSRSGVKLKSTERLQIYQNNLIKGIRSAVLFYNPNTDDFSEYNFTVSNDFGSDWKLLRMSNEASLPVIFVIGSGAATGLAVIFVVIIGCLIRYSRTHSTQSTDSKNNAVKLTFKPNGIAATERNAEQPRTTETELYSLARSLAASSIGSDLQSPVCHFCLAAQNPAFLDTQIEVDDMLGSGTAVNCKKSDDSGCELGDVTSIGPGPNDATCREKTTTVCREFQPLLNTIFLQNPHVVGYPSNKALSDTVRNNSKYGKTFFNAYAGTDMDPSTNLTSAQQRPVQMQPMCDQSTNIMYDSIHGSSTFERPLLTKSLSPILVVTPTLAQSNVSDNSILPTSLFIPQVVFSSPNGLVTSPVKSSCITPRLPSPSLHSIVPNDSSSLLRNAPDIYPDLSVSPLKFSDDKPGFSASSNSSNAILVCSIGHTKNDHQSSSETRPASQLTEVFTSRNCSDDNGTTI